MQENQVIIVLILGVAMWCFLWYIFAKVVFLKKIKTHRKSAVQKSRSVLLGQVSEQIAPLLPNFPYNYKDVMFMGKWVDYIVFDWLSEWNVDQVVFLEVKTGRSGLNKNERMIKNAIERGNVEYEVLRI